MTKHLENTSLRHHWKDTHNNELLKNTKPTTIKEITTKLNKEYNLFEKFLHETTHLIHGIRTKLRLRQVLEKIRPTKNAIFDPRKIRQRSAKKGCEKSGEKMFAKSRPGRQFSFVIVYFFVKKLLDTRYRTITKTVQKRSYFTTHN